MCRPTRSGSSLLKNVQPERSYWRTRAMCYSRVTPGIALDRIHGQRVSAFEIRCFIIALAANIRIFNVGVQDQQLFNCCLKNPKTKPVLCFV